MPAEITSPHKCLECRGNIPLDAIKCTECDAYQDWRRHLNLNFSGVILSLLIALISVSSVCVPLILRAFEPKDAKLNFVPIRADHRPATEGEIARLTGQGASHNADEKKSTMLFVEVAASNSGTKAAVVTKLEIEGVQRNGSSKKDWLELLLIENQRPSSIIVPPGASVVLKGIFREHEGEQLPVEWNSSEIRPHIRLTFVCNNGTTVTNIPNQRLERNYDFPSF